MKTFRKVIAVILTLILTASIAMPVASAASGDELGDHTSFEDFWGQMTDEEGNIQWKKLPEVLFKVFFFVRLFEVIAEWVRGIFGIEVAPESEVVSVAEVA